MKTYLYGKEFNNVEINTGFNSPVIYYKVFYIDDKKAALKIFNVEVLTEIDKIYDYVSKYPVDWEIDTMETVLERLEKDISAYFSQKT